MKKVDVVIPNYNGLKYLEGCFSSLFAQKEAPDFQVILVDNGSSDGSVAWTREHYPQIQIMELDHNTGFCHAVNVGIQAGEGEYVILLNNDTRCDGLFIKSLWDRMKGDETGRLFSASACMLDWKEETVLDGAGDNYTLLGWPYARGKGREASSYDKSVRIFSACGGAAIYRRSVLEEIGLFDENHFAYLEDVDLGYRANIAGYYNCYEPKARVVHFGSGTSGSRYNSWKTGIVAENSVYLVYKNMPFLQWLINVPFLFLGKLIKWLFFCKKGMGKEYLTGLYRGLQKSVSERGRKHKIRFKMKNLPHYFRIQGAMILNTVRFLKKS